MNNIEAVCRETKNWFVIKKISGEFEIKDGNIAYAQSDLPAKTNQYFRVIGSIFNDGIHKFPDTNLVDEAFSGEIWLLAIPPAFLSLCDKIEAWSAENGKALDSPYSSESFGGYSYSISSTSGGKTGWQAHFASQLNAWRRI